MSNMSLNFHSTAKVTAEACSGSGAEWVELTVIDHRGNDNPIAIFFKPRGLAERFAAAINSVNDEAEKIKAQHREMDADKSRVPAGHTDAFADECQRDYDEERQHGWAVG